MAFDIGQRVTSRWTGPGTVTGELHKDEDGDALQEVAFDSPMLGRKNWMVKKLTPLDDETGEYGPKA